MKKELISQHSILTYPYQLAALLKPSLFFTNHFIYVKPTYFYFFNYKFKANYFQFFSTFLKKSILGYRVSEVSVKPKAFVKKFSLFYKTLKLRKIFFIGYRKNKKLKIKELLRSPKLYFFNDSPSWSLKGLPFTYLNRFLLSSRTCNKFFLEKVKKKLFLSKFSDTFKKKLNRKRVQRPTIPRSPVSEAFFPKPYLYFLDGAREANPRTTLLFRLLKSLSFRHLIPKEKKVSFVINTKKKLLNLKKRLAFSLDSLVAKKTSAVPLLKSSRTLFLKSRVPALLTRRAILFKRLFNTFFKKNGKSVLPFEVVLKKKLHTSKILLRKSELRNLLLLTFNKKLKIRFRKFFTKEAPVFPKHKSAFLNLPKRANKGFLLYNFFKNFLSLLNKRLTFMTKDAILSPRFFFFWKNLIGCSNNQALVKKISLRKYNNSIKPQLLNSFSFGTYGYFYITPLYEVFSKKGILGIVVSLYSFSFFHDIKNFFLRSYRPSINFMGKFTSDPFYESEILDTQNGTDSLGSLPNQPYSRELSPQVPNWTTVLRVPTTYGLSRVRRIRFKPGYSRIWRYARSSLKFLWSLNFKYQHRLTVFLTRFQRFNKIQMARCYELRVYYVLSHSYFSPDLSLSNSLFNSNLVFINGRLCKNPNLVLVVNDVVQLIVSYKYYITQRWLTIFKKKKVFRLTKFLFTKKNKIFSGSSTLMTTRFPKWLLDSIFFKSDIPKYLEIDFFTLSIFLVYEPFFVNDFNPLTWKLHKFSVINLYNWKYIN